MKLNRRNLFLPAAISLTLTAHQASGATRTWDGSSNTNWGTGANWDTAPVAADTVVFNSTGAGSVYLGTAARTIAGITFNSATPYTIFLRTSAADATNRQLTVDNILGIDVDAGSHTIKGDGTGDELSFKGNSTFTIAANSTLTLEAKLSGRGLTKSGPGTLVVKGTNNTSPTWNSQAEGHTVAQGTMDLAASGASGNSNSLFIVNSGATLKLSIAGGWSSTTGALNLNGTTSASGALYASATSSLSANTLLLATTSSIGVDANRTLTLGSAITGTGAAGLTKVGNGTLTLNGNNTFTGNTTISAGTLRIGDGSTSGSITNTTGVTNNAVLVFNRSNDFSAAYPISGNGTVEKLGAGTLTLSGNNTFTGGTTVNAGTLLLSGANNMPANGTLQVNAGGTFSLADGTARANTTTAALGLVSGASLTFDWNAGNLDTLTSTAAATTAGTVRITINNTSPTGLGGTLISSPPGGLSGAGYFLINNTNYTAALTVTDTAVSIGNITTGLTALTDAYWLGGQLTGTALGAMALANGTSNWASNANGTSAGGVVPGGSAVNVIFSAANATEQASVITGANMNLGSLTFNDGAAVTIAGSDTITLNSTSPTAATSSGSGTTVTPGSAITVTSAANAANTLNANIQLASNQTWNVASTKTLTVGGTVGGTGSLTKADVGTLTLSGNNNYTGTTIIDQGTLAITTNNSLTGGLTFGANASSTTASALDLTNGNSTFGSLLVNTNAAANNTIAIGGTKMLTINGNVLIGASPAVVTSTSNLTMTGGGAFNVTTGAGGNFTVGANVGNVTQNARLDLSALQATTINLSSTGTLKVGGSNANQGGAGNLLLSNLAVADTVATTTITAGTIAVAAGDSNNAFNKITLGTGLTTLNVGNINVGGGSRDVGQIVYGNATGDLIIRGANGTSRATAINIAVNAAATTTVTGTNTVGFNGHDADILVTSLNVGSNARGSAGLINEFLFDEGDNSLTGGFSSKLDATSVNIGFRTGGNNTIANTMTSRVNLSGGTVVFGNGTAGGTGVDIGSNALGNATVTGLSNTVGELNISGGNATIHNGNASFAVRLGTNVALGTANVTASMNLTGGTTTLGGDIIKGVTSPRTTSSLALNGANATLDMGGHDITGLTSITYTAGLLKNLGTVNTDMTLAGNGSRVFDQGNATSGIIQGNITGSGLGLTKQGLGNLTLSGNNTYTGNTTIDNGKILASHNSAFGTGNVSVSANSTPGLQLQLSEGVNVGNRLTMNGGSTGGQGVLYAVGNSTYSGDVTINSNVLGGGGHFGSAATKTLTLNGNITSSADVTIRNGTVILNGTGSSYTVLNNQGAIVRLGANDVIAAGAAVTIGSSADAILDLNGFNQSLGNLTGANATRAIIASSSTTANSTLTITGNNTYAGLITNVTGSGNKTVGLTVNSGGTFTLSGNNTYTGNTTISGGILALGVSGSIADSPTITVASAAVLDVTAQSAFAIGANQTLTGGGNVTGNTTVNGNLAPGTGIGQLTFTGGNLTLGTLAADSLKFELGANTTAGTTYDTVATSALDIGTGILDFPDFQFTGTPAAGTYTLISSASTTGTLGGNLTGSIGAFTGTLSQSANNVILTVASSGSAYSTWSGGAGFYADANGDGVPNGMTWLLGGANTTSNGLVLLPAPVVSGGNMTLSFKTPALIAPAQLLFEYGTNLVTWSTPAVPVPLVSGNFTNGTFTVTPIGNGTNNNVVLTVNGNASVGGKLFGRFNSKEN